MTVLNCFVDGILTDFFKSVFVSIYEYVLPFVHLWDAFPPIGAQVFDE